MKNSFELPTQENPENVHNVHLDPAEETLVQLVQPVQETPNSPAQLAEFEDISTELQAKTPTSSRRSFLKGGLAALGALAAGSLGTLPSTAKAEEAPLLLPEKTPEQQKAILEKIGLSREEIKPEFLKKYFAGEYKAVVVINTDFMTQTLNLYDDEGTVIIRNAEITSGYGKGETATPTGSFESGKSYKLYVNHDNIDMPYAVAIDAGKGVYMHKGAQSGVSSSHGCVRLKIDIAKQIYDLATDLKDLLIVIINKETTK